MGLLRKGNHLVSSLNDWVYSTHICINCKQTSKSKKAHVHFWFVQLACKEFLFM